MSRFCTLGEVQEAAASANYSRCRAPFCPEVNGNRWHIPCVRPLQTTVGRARDGRDDAALFGLNDTQLLDVFPNLKNFDASKRGLGFMA